MAYASPPVQTHSGVRMHALRSLFIAAACAAWPPGPDRGDLPAAYPATNFHSKNLQAPTTWTRPPAAS